MAAAIDTEQMKSGLECSICLQKMVNPKILTCSHKFCKECLEEILVFREDGSAIVACPLKDCSHQTVINVNQTLNDLMAFESDNLQDDEETGDDVSQIPMCTYVDGCMNNISMYCCEQKMCQSCSVNHENSQLEHHSKVNVYFCKREKKLKGFCQDHFSTFTHLCCDTTFLCKYCLHRNELHKDHEKNTIESEVKSIKEALLDDLANRQKMEEFRKATEAHVPVMKEQLDVLLEERRKACMEQYLAYLNAQEEQIKDKFRDICDNVRLLSELTVSELGYE